MAVQTRQAKEERPKTPSLTASFNAASFGDKLKEGLDFLKNLSEKAPDGKTNLQHMLQDFGSQLGEIGTVLKDIFNSVTSSAPTAAPSPAPQVAAQPVVAQPAARPAAPC